MTGILTVVMSSIFIFSSVSFSAPKKSGGKCDSYLDASFSRDTTISPEWVQAMGRRERSSSQNRLDQAVQTSGLRQVGLNRDVIANHTNSYTHELPLSCITNQAQSGRCWIFAGNNMLRTELVRSQKVDADFSMSHTYLHFFNMLEKANRWISTAEKSHLENVPRKFDQAFVDSNHFGDGGWYSWYQFLVSKYGLVPNSAMPDTASSTSTSMIIDGVTTILTGAGLQIKALADEAKIRTKGRYTAKQKAALLKIREEAMEKVFSILVTHLGAPPTEFQFRGPAPVKSAAKKSTEPKLVKKTGAVLKTYTPQTFRDEFVQYRPQDYVIVANNPRYPYKKYYELKDSTIGVPSHQGENFPERMLNLPYERLEKLITDSIDAGVPVWFGTGVSQALESAPVTLSKTVTGIWHPEIYKEAEVYGLKESDFKLSREDQMEFRLSLMTHAMAIVAYDRPDPKSPIVKLKVENSWDKTWGDKGYGHMYREWAELYLDEIVVHRALLTDEELKLLEGAPEVVDEYDFF